MGILERLFLAVGGILLIFPGALTDGLGLLLIAAAIAVQFVKKSKKKAA